MVNIESIFAIISAVMLIQGNNNQKEKIETLWEQ